MSTLEDRIDAYNKAVRAANEWFPLIRKAYEPFVGKRIIKTTGGLMAKVQVVTDALELPKEVDLFFQRAIGNEYVLSYDVKAYKSGRSQVVNLRIGSLQNGILVEVDEHPNLMVRTAEEIRTAREEYTKAKRVVSQWENAMYPFGTYDV